MATAVRFYETGAPEVMRLVDVDAGAPGPGQALIRHVAIGLNFADTYFRTGLYPTPLPSGLGVEGAGIIEDVGEAVTQLKVGDRVAYTGSPLGAYSTERVMGIAPLLKLPESITCATAAAMMMRGLTAGYLLRRLYQVKTGSTILVHAAAGGVGLILCQWAKILGATVIGTVSSEAKAEMAHAHGCDHVINYTREDVPARVRALTGGAGVPVVYDGVGRSTFAGSIDSLARRGMMVCFGTASGPLPPIDPFMLALKGSLFLTRPALADYLADRADAETLASELFGHVAHGRIKIQIGQRYELAAAIQAHHDLEARRTMGSSIFVMA